MPHAKKFFCNISRTVDYGKDPIVEYGNHKESLREKRFKPYYILLEYLLSLLFSDVFQSSKKDYRNILSYTITVTVTDLCTVETVIVVTL